MILARARHVKRLLAFASLLFFVSTGTAQAVTLTFDDLSGSGTLADGYGGINWGGDWGYFDAFQDPYTPSSAPERIYSPNTGSGEYSFDFVTPDQVFVGAYFSGYDLATVSFNLYNDGILVWTSGSLAPSSTPTFLASGYGGPVDSVGVFSALNDFYVMDDVTYNATLPEPIPEPTSILLVATGIAGAALRRRRR
jgi:PEP-CTERM motif-containing protein